MNDLDKLMEKLKKDDPVDATVDVPDEETPVVVPKVEEKPVVVAPKVEETPVLDDDDDDEDVVAVKSPAKVSEAEDNTEEHAYHDANPIEQEVALLQNVGVFRRELLVTLKEMVDVQRVQAQLLIDLTKNGSQKTN